MVLKVGGELLERVRRQRCAGRVRDDVNRLAGPLVEVRRVGDRAPQPASAPALLTPAGAGDAEAPPSARLDTPPTQGSAP